MTIQKVENGILKNIKGLKGELREATGSNGKNIKGLKVELREAPKPLEATIRKLWERSWKKIQDLYELGLEMELS